MLFGISEETVRRLCQSGRIPAVNVGVSTSAQWRIPLSYIDAAMRGEARWKYPKSLRRQCVTKRVAQRRIAHVEAELERIARNQVTWEDEEDE